jgi:hypothetical protein
MSNWAPSSAALERDADSGNYAARTDWILLIETATLGDEARWVSWTATLIV